MIFTTIYFSIIINKNKVLSRGKTVEWYVYNDKFILKTRRGKSDCDPHINSWYLLYRGCLCIITKVELEGKENTNRKAGLWNLKKR